MVARPHPARRRRRRGVILLESALVYTVTFTLLLGTMVMGLGVFQYQQVAGLAREGSRWAAVRGATYQSEQKAAAPTDADLKAAVLQKAVVLNSAALTCDLDQTKLAAGIAKVTLTYRWTPEAFFAPVTMTSTSETPVLY